MEITINELRNGSLLNYDTSEGDILPTTIDWQDLKWLDEDPKGFNLVHSPIRITEDFLEKMGFEGNIDIGFKKDVIELNFITTDDHFQFEYRPASSMRWFVLPVKYIHHLQNLFFTLTQTELVVPSAVGEKI